MIEQPLEVTQTSGASLEFKIPEQFQNLPFQEMTLADIEQAVLRHPVYENSGMQPLNILPDPPQEMPAAQQPASTPMPVATTPATPTVTTAMPAAPAPQPVQAQQYAPYATRQQSIGVPPRS